MRGEHLRNGRRIMNPLGSSPHARGARWRPAQGRRRSGIIPACAGSTNVGGAAATQPRDHPRMRGEHGWWVLIILFALGSSPHARGALCSPSAGSSNMGIIPACAGSTNAVTVIEDPTRDHPRMRGEHIDTGTEAYYFPGSSPHARGAQGDTVVVNHDDGIIPACAGSTPARPAAARSLRDHPRMRGEH